MKLTGKNFNTKSLEGGYSLMETIIYVALFIMLAAVLVGALYGMSNAYAEVRVNDDLLDSANASMSRISREIRDAVSIDTADSTFDAAPGVLVLNSLDGSGSPKTVEFDVSPAGALEVLDSTDGTPRDLTGSDVEVASLVFRDVATTVGQAVKVEVTFQSTRGSSHQQVEESDTIVLRGSY